jgi:large subunit ribosomal protein L25
MNILKATKRETVSVGQINKLRAEGSIPAILYGGEKDNLKISLKKLHLQNIIKTETFMSKVFDLDIDGQAEKALAREIAYDPLSDEPIHIDFLRITKGSKIILEIPVNFINQDKSPGLKKGGVLNIVRRKVELKCPTENIPNEIIVDLNNIEINTSLKISSVKLPEGVVPTITDRDFVIGTVVAPTVLVEPEKTEEATVEGEAPAEGAEANESATEGKDKATGSTDEKGKSAKSTDEKAKAATSDKNKPENKENKKK